MITESSGTGRRVSINILPDDVLLDIFDHYVILSQRYPYEDQQVDAWHTLVHVCQRWRYVVFDSPRRLDLRLRWTNRTPVTNMLDIWLALPIVISAYDPLPANGVSNIISALQQHNRVCTINIDFIPKSPSLLVAMQGPFPALTKLRLWSYNKYTPVLPDSFLGGSAPRLREVLLWGIPFPALPKLLLSTNDLVTLCLTDIPRSGYISPQELITSLSALTKLNSLELGFQFPPSLADGESQCPPSQTFVVLPAVTKFLYKGNSEYLDDFVSRLDAPLLDKLDIVFFNLLVFDIPQLCRFISRTETFKAPDRVEVLFDTFGVEVDLFQRKGMTDRKVLGLRISNGSPDRQLSSLAQVCNSSMPPLPTLESLCIHEGQYFRPQWHNNMEHAQWLELLRRFSSVKDLVLSKKLVQLVAPALREIIGTAVLPVLQNLYLEGPQPSGPVQEAVGQFLAARDLFGCPVTVHHRGNGDQEYKHWEADDDR